MRKARETSPKEIGGLSIEGLAGAPNGHLLIGFRNPLTGGKINGDKFLENGKSLVVELQNPQEVLKGSSAKFGDPIELDLDGLSIRSLEYSQDRNQYIIVAGSYFGNTEPSETKTLPSRIYLWSGQSKDKPKLLEKINLTGINPEAALFIPIPKKVLLNC